LAGQLPGLITFHSCRCHRGFIDPSHGPVTDGRLARFLSCPAGAESTGLHAVDGVNGFNYIMSNFQHPGDWNGLSAETEDVLNANHHDRFSAAVGYLAITGVKTS